MKNENILVELAKKLRSETGCPWDKEQTLESMCEYLTSETEEVIQAVKNKDYKNLNEELGDVLFQIVMMSQIAQEQGLFDFDSVNASIEKKIIDRHSWVFGKDKGKVKTPEDALKYWKNNKKKEKTN